MNNKNRNRFGLTDRDMESIFSIFDDCKDVTSVYIFGSRAKGSHNLGSDIDLAIMDRNLPEKKIRELKSDFEESTLPYNVDLIHYPALDKREFIDHIDRVGVPFYSRKRKSVPDMD